MNSKLKILQIVEATGGGVGRHVLDLCERLSEAGHEVHLAYSTDRMEPGFANRLAGLGHLGLLPLSMPRSPHPRDLRALIQIGRYLRQNRPFSIVHGHSSKGGALARASAAILGLPSVYTPNAFRTQDPELASIGFRFYREVELCLAGLGGEIIAVSSDERKHATSIGLPSQRLHVVHNGISMQRQPEERLSRKQFGLDEASVVIGAVGRLTHQKAPERLLTAMARLEHPNLHLVVVGDGPKEAQVKRQAEKLGIAERTHWLGNRDGFSVMPLFDMLALPSRYEGLPYVLLEALLVGLPIVVSDVGGAREAVIDGENGRVVPEGDLDQLVDALQQLLNRPMDRERMGTAAKKRSTEFSLSRMVARTIDVYQAAIERRG